MFWGYLAGLHKNRDLVGRVGDIADYVWISQSIANISLCCVQMGLSGEHVNRLKKLIKKNLKSGKAKDLEEVDSMVAKIRELQEDSSELPLEMIKSVCDSIVRSLLRLRLRYTS